MATAPLSNAMAHHHHHQQQQHHQQQHYNYHPNTNNVHRTSIMGPRAKCDQVVYEAIAKAAEIIVRSRCRVPSSSSSSRMNTQAFGSNVDTTGGGAAIVGNYMYPRKSHRGIMPYGGAVPGGTATAATTTTAGTSSSRFNLEVEEVEEVRSILQRWKRSLHVPLRLDIFYEYDVTEDVLDGNNAPNSHQTEQQQPIPKKRRELLERWCIDYVATSSDDIMTTISNEDTIVQLRRVCKRVVILLRSLHSLTRMMPAFALHRLLKRSFRAVNSTGNNSAGSSSGSSGGLFGGGYYQNPSEGQPTRPFLQEGEIAGGDIGYSFYVSGHDSDDGILLSSNSSHPFARQMVGSVPTPYGVLHLTALYDPSLSVKDIVSRHERQLYPRHQSQAIQVPKNNANNNNSDDEEETNAHTPDSHLLRRHNSLPSKQIRAISVSPKNYMSRETSAGSLHAGEYGYGYNNMQSSAQISPAEGAQISPAEGAQIQNQTLPNADTNGIKSGPSSLSNTPPQPMFMQVGSTPPFGHLSPYAPANVASLIPPLPVRISPADGGGGGGMDQPEEKTNNACEGTSTSAGGSKPSSSPPFRANPLSLCASNAPGLPSGSNSINNNNGSGPAQGPKVDLQQDHHLLPPLTSMDQLPLSPFKTAEHGGSLLSSLTMGGATTAAAVSYGFNSRPDDAMPFGAPSFAATTSTNGLYNHASSSAVHPSRNIPGSELTLRSSGGSHAAPFSMDATHPIGMEQPSTSFDDMPFAVELPIAGGSNTTASSGVHSGAPASVGGLAGEGMDPGMTSSIASSQVVTSLAHKCATAGRLRLFSHDDNGDDDNRNDSAELMNKDGQSEISVDDHQSSHVVSSLADQLAEFRSFGATLQQTNSQSNDSRSVANSGSSPQ